MAIILQFPRSHSSFGPDTLDTLGRAYDLAVSNIREQPEIVCELMAHRIMAAAMKGERDPDQLCAGRVARNYAAYRPWGR